MSINVEDTDIQYHMDLCELQADQFFLSRKENGIEFFKLLPKDKYPNLRNFGLQIISMFGSTYICEKGFSDMKYIKSKYRNSISDSKLEEIIRISTTNIEIDFKFFLSEQRHLQLSH